MCPKTAGARGYPTTELRWHPLPHNLFVSGNYRGSPSFKVLEEHVKILMMPVWENTTCHNSLKLFKSPEQLYNINTKIVFGSLIFQEKLMV